MAEGNENDIDIRLRTTGGPQSQQTFKSLAQDVRLASADFRAGTLSAAGYKDAINFARSEAVALRTQGVVPVGREVSSLGAIFRKTGRDLNETGHGLGTMRSSMATLGFAALGLRSNFGTLIGGLLQFSFGNLTALGITAGIAAIGLAIAAIRDRAKEAQNRLNSLFASAKQFNTTKLSELGALLTQASEQETIAEAKLKKAQDFAVSPGGLVAAAVQGVEPFQLKSVTDAQDTLNKVTQAKLTFQREIAEEQKRLRGEAAGDARKTAEESVRARDKEIADLTKLNLMRLSTQEQLFKMLIIQRELTLEMEKQLSVADRIKVAEQLAAIRAAASSRIRLGIPDLLNTSSQSPPLSLGTQLQVSAGNALSGPGFQRNLTNRFRSFGVNQFLQNAHQNDLEESAKAAQKEAEERMRRLTGGIHSASNAIIQFAANVHNGADAAAAFAAAAGQFAQSVIPGPFGAVLGLVGGVFSLLSGSRTLPVSVEKVSPQVRSDLITLIPRDVSIQIVSADSGVVMDSFLFQARDKQNRNGVFSLPPNYTVLRTGR